MKLRPAVSGDFSAILVLNEESVHFLSPLTSQRLIALDGEAERHLVLERDRNVIAFLLAFRDGAAYDSPNYQWFARRYPRFLYVDRIVVSGSAQGAGAGRLLYDHVFAHARDIGAPIIACEYDVDPPNVASARFHAGFGFREVGRQTVAAGTKTVSLQVADV